MPASLPDDGLERGIARIRSADGQVTGSGFLVAADVLCTCAHVVARALGIEETGAEAPRTPLWVDFPLPDPVAARVRARVIRWVPVMADSSGDIALLKLEEALPGTAPVRFAGGDDFWDHRFRVLGFPPRTEDHGVWVQGRLGGRVGLGWTSMETRESPHGPAIDQGFSGAPVWDVEQGGVVGMTVAADRGHAATTAYLIPAAHLLDLDPALLRSPFRGLEPFREQDAAVFFGRRADSERIARAVQAETFVPVVGASGVGKSSLVRAGVLPLLRIAGYTLTDFTAQPGATPVRVLLATLQDQFPQAPTLRELARESGRHATEDTAVLIGARLLEHSGPAGHVVVLDQFEEAVGAQPAGARELLDTLLAMTRARDPQGRRLRVLATLRSASLEELVAGGDAEHLSVPLQMIAPMTPSQLAEIVRRPLEAVPGIDFEAGLPERIVADAGTGPGALPLVEFVLARLWDERDRGRLTHLRYRELGGVEGALAAYADRQLDEVCKGTDGLRTATVRRLFVQLALPHGDQGYARAPLAYDTLPPDLRTAAQALASTRLLVIAGDRAGRQTVALAHESLVRQWPTLRAWLDDSRAFRVWQERLRSRMREWQEGERDPDLLLRGRELSDARPLVAANSDELLAEERQFISLSRQQGRRVRLRSRTVLAVTAVLAVLALVLGIGVWRGTAASERHEREEAARRLVQLAERSADRDPVLAARLALAAWDTGRTTGAYEAMLERYLPVSSLREVRTGQVGGQARDLAASADGRRIAVLRSAPGGKVQVLLLPSAHSKGRPLPLPGTPPLADSVAVSDDGERVAAADPEGRVVVWSARSREVLDRWDWRPAEDIEGTRRLDFSADGRVVAQVMKRSECADPARFTTSSAHVHRVGGAAIGVPSVGPRRCVSDLALPAGANDTVLVVTDTTVVTGIDDLLGEQSVVLHRAQALGLTTGRQRWSTEQVAGVTVGAGGRGLAVRPERRPWSFRTPASGAGVRAAGSVEQALRSDATGRFFGELDNQATAMVWHDSRSAHRYLTFLPDEEYAAGQYDRIPTAVVPAAEAGRPPVIRSVLGPHMVSLATVPTDFPMAGASAGNWSAIAQSAFSRVRVAAESWSTSDGSDSRTTVTVLGPGGRLIREDADRDVPRSGQGAEAVVSADGRWILYWNARGWVRYDTELEPRGHGRLNGFGGEGPPVRAWPLGAGDFLLLDAVGLHRLSSATGKVSPVREPDCAGARSTDPDWCGDVVSRPGEADQVLVVRLHGVELWDLRTGRRLHRHTMEPSRFSPRHAFRDDGEVAAVTTDQGVMIWDPDRDRVVRELDMGGAGAVEAFARDGRMVVDVNLHRAQLWDVETGQRVAILNFPDHVGGWSLAANSVTALYGTGQARLPLGRDALVQGLCRAVGDTYPDSVLRKFPPHTDRTPPC
ncbi:trypsin-like peptidase domain-containing protein [Streptomyces canus]|uniref:nSTAND1 domain-containing NTPase n=1 Tax=Streptomyces canus TaxID=58343 RepID=UPI0036766C4E